MHNSYNYRSYLSEVAGKNDIIFQEFFFHFKVCGEKIGPFDV